MSVKFPLNGRYATLGDLVHEYAKYSTKPETVIIEEWDISTYGCQPFSYLIYGEQYTGTLKAQVPYELVWFDNVYSDTEKADDNKTMKIVLASDASIYSFGKEIPVIQVSDANKILREGFKFRFIIASSWSNSLGDRWYFNYKTSNGEATVMFAIRNIIETLKTRAYEFLFGSDIIELSLHNDKRYSLIKASTTHIFTYCYIKKSVTDNNNYSFIIVDLEYASPLISGDNCASYEAVKNLVDDEGYNIFDTINNILNTIELTDTDKYKDLYLLYLDDDEKDNYIICKKYTNWTIILSTLNIVNDEKINPDFKFGDGKIEANGLSLIASDALNDIITTYSNNNIDLILLKNDAYQYLGDIIWSKKYVLYDNYSSGETIEPLTTIDPDSSYNFILNNEEVRNTIYNSSDINITIDKFLGITDDTNITDYTPKLLSSINDNIVYKIKYLCKIFLDSQRFYTSYVSNFLFVNISNKSYAQREPVLRCDLDMKRVYESFEILDASHNRTTALTLRPLSGDTTIRIDYRYAIEYKGIENKTIGTASLYITFDDIYKATKDYKKAENKDDVTTWYGLIPNTEENINEATPALYGTLYFKALFEHKDIAEDNDKNTTDGSLGNLKWTKNVILQVNSEDELNRRIGVGLYGTDIWCDDTANKDNLEDDADIYNKAYMPFGTLYIKDIYVPGEEKTKFQIWVPIYRCYNWYYSRGESSDNDTAELTSFFNIPFINHVSLTSISLYKGTKDTDISEVELNLCQNPGEVNMSYYNGLEISLYFILTVGQAARIVYASGYEEISENKTVVNSAINSANLKIDIYNESSQDKWLTINNGISKYTNKDLDCYKINTTEPTKALNNAKYTYCRVYIDGEDICFYYKITSLSNNKSLTEKFRLITLAAIDFAESKINSGEYMFAGETTINNIKIYHCLYNLDSDANLLGTAGQTNSYSNSYTLYDCVTLGESTNNTNNYYYHNKKTTFRLTAISYSSNVEITTTYLYNDNNYNTLYLYHVDNTGERYSGNKNLFTDYEIDNFNPTNLSILYLAFNPIYCIYVPATDYFVNNVPDSGVQNINITHISYKPTNATSILQIQLDNSSKSIFSFITADVTLKTDDVQIITQDSGILTLTNFLKSDMIIELDVELYRITDGNKAVYGGTAEKFTLTSYISNNYINQLIFNLSGNTTHLFKFILNKYEENKNSNSVTIILNVLNADLTYLRVTYNSNILKSGDIVPVGDKITLSAEPEIDLKYIDNNNEIQIAKATFTGWYIGGLPSGNVNPWVDFEVYQTGPGTLAITANYNNPAITYISNNSNVTVTPSTGGGSSGDGS